MTKKHKTLIVFIVFQIFILSKVYAQSNTFPGSGNVGIGTISPSELLDVEGKAEFGLGTGVLKIKKGNFTFDGQERTYLFHDSGTNRKIGLGITDDGTKRNYTKRNYIELFEGNSPATQYIDFDINGNSTMRINSNGDIGIGTIGPSELLDVEGNAEFGLGTGVLKIKKGNFTFDGQERTYLFHDSGTNRKIGLGITDDGTKRNYIELFEGNSPATQYIDFGINGNSTMRIDSYENIGIGTTTPTQKLDVNGTIKSDKIIVDDIESTGKASISGLDLNGDRNPNASSIGLNLSASNYTNIHITHDIWSGSHGLLFNSYQAASNPTGNLSVLGNTKYANDVGSFSGGAGSIMYFGNYGNMGFYISPTSTGKDDDVIWGEPKLWLKRNGNVGIGTTTPSHKLSVAGTINSEEIIVEENVGADFVFEDSYDLPSLQDIEAFIEQNQHLPGIAPASQMIEEGVKVGELQMQLLQKIEEMTLIMIKMEKRIQELESLNK